MPGSQTNKAHTSIFLKKLNIVEHDYGNVKSKKDGSPGVGMLVYGLDWAGPG